MSTSNGHAPNVLVRAARRDLSMPFGFARYDAHGQPSLTRDLADEIVQRLAPMLHGSGDGWMDSAAAAVYVGRPLSSIRKLTAARQIPFEQATPNARCYFRRSDLDEWMQSGCRPL